MKLTHLFTINILSYKGLHDCVKEVKNLEQLKEREAAEMVLAKMTHFLVLRRGREIGKSDSCESPVETRVSFYVVVVLGYVREKCLFYVILRGSNSGPPS